MKLLTNCENLFSNPLQVKLVTSKDVPKARKPPGILKIVPKALNVHWRKSTVEREGKPEQKFDAAFGTILNL
jgi:hypothetical protein